MKPEDIQKLKYLPLVAVLCMISPSYASEVGAGIIIGIAQPNYGKYQALTQGNNMPGLPEKPLALGGQVAFRKKNFITGGRILTTSTYSNKSTNASYYSLISLSFFTGYQWKLSSVVSLAGSIGMGMGTTTFSLANASSGSVVEALYLLGEPGGSISFELTPNFKLSFEGCYQYGIPYRVTELGSTILAQPNEASVGGIFLFVGLQFGF